MGGPIYRMAGKSSMSLSFYNCSFNENYSRIAQSMGQTGVRPHDPESKGTISTIQRGAEYGKHSSSLDNTIFANIQRPRTARDARQPRRKDAKGSERGSSYKAIAQAVCRNQMLVKCMFKAGGSVPGTRWVPSAPCTPRVATPVNPIKELRQVHAWANCGVKADSANLQGSDMVSWPELRKILQHCGLKLRQREFDGFIHKLKQVTGAKFSVAYEAFVQYITWLDSSVEFNLTHTEERVAEELKVAQARAPHVRRTPLTARTMSRTSPSSNGRSQQQRKCNIDGCGAQSLEGMNGCGAQSLSRSIYLRGESARR